MGGTEPRRGAIPDLRALGRPGQGPMSPGLPAPSFTIQPPTSAACGLAAIPAVGGAKRQRTLPGRSEVEGNSGKDRQHDPEPDGRLQILPSSLLAFWASASYLTSLCLWLAGHKTELQWVTVRTKPLTRAQHRAWLADGAVGKLLPLFVKTPALVSDLLAVTVCLCW